MTELTFEQAREIVRKAREIDWENDDMPGTYMVAEYGWEDAEAFLVVDGAKEGIVDNDVDFIVMDAPAVFVHKATGTVLLADFLTEQDRIRAMTPVGNHPVEPDE